MQGEYPVIALSFADIKGDTFETARDGMVQVIIDLYAKFSYILQGNRLNQQEKEYFNYGKTDVLDVVAAMALKRLVICLNRYYRKKVIIF